MFIVGFVSEAIARGRGTEAEVMSELRERSLSFLSRERQDVKIPPQSDRPHAPSVRCQNNAQEGRKDEVSSPGNICAVMSPHSQLALARSAAGAQPYPG